MTSTIALILVAIVVGSVIVGGTAIYFMRARFREKVGAPPSNQAASSAPVADEVRAIGAQIEQIATEQQLQGETQRQLLAQKLDGVRQSVEAQRNHVESLRSEMRHETRRRDVEMDEIRTQIGTLQSAVSLPPADRLALPEPSAETETAETAPMDSAPFQPVEESPALPTENSTTFATADLFIEPSIEDADDQTDAESATPDEVPEASAFSPDDIESFSFSIDDFEPSVSEPLDAVETPAFSNETPSADPFGEVTFGDSTAPALPEPMRAPEPAASVDAPSSDDLFETWMPSAEFSAEEPSDDESPTMEPESIFSDSMFEEIRFEAPQPTEDPAAPSATSVEADTPLAPIEAPISSVPIEFVPDAPSSTVSVPSEDAPSPVKAAPATQTESAPFFADFWTPPAPSAETVADEPQIAAPTTETASKFETNWIARPDREEPESDKPQIASADDFFSIPASDAPSADAVADDAPAADALLNLDDLTLDVAPAPSSLDHETPDALSTAPVAAPEMDEARPALAAVEAQISEPFTSDSLAATLPVSTPVAPEFAAPEMETLDAVADIAGAEVPSPESAALDQNEPEPFVAPEGADDLTVITSIDQDLQRLLYLEGVTTLEEIAQWGRTRARQIAIAVSISEETIMNQWVFEAQAAMFDQFSGMG